MIFPFSLYREFLEEARRREVRVITYDDIFRETEDRNYLDGYLREYQAWRRRHRRPPPVLRWFAGDDWRHPYLLIQHDIDTLPECTKRMVEMEMEFGVRSNIFMFHEQYPLERHARSYDVDHGFFREAEQEGYVIGYHSNAVQHAGFDLEAAERRFVADVEALRRHYRIRYFCPHGGQGKSVDGETLHNNSLPVPEALADDILWVYNRYGLRHAARWSDGGVRQNATPERLRRLDIVGEFLGGMKPGERYFALLHPNYWRDQIRTDLVPGLAREPWFQRVCREHAGIDLGGQG